MGVFRATGRHHPPANHRIAFMNTQTLICKTAHGLRTADAEQVVLRDTEAGGGGGVTALDAQRDHVAFSQGKPYLLTQITAHKVLVRQHRLARPAHSHLGQ